MTENTIGLWQIPVDWLNEWSVCSCVPSMQYLTSIQWMGWLLMHILLKISVWHPWYNVPFHLCTYECQIRCLLSTYEGLHAGDTLHVATCEAVPNTALQNTAFLHHLSNLRPCKHITICHLDPKVSYDWEIPRRNTILRDFSDAARQPINSSCADNLPRAWTLTRADVKYTSGLLISRDCVFLA